jgi:hypothetical protein
MSTPSRSLSSLQMLKQLVQAASASFVRNGYMP